MNRMNSNQTALCFFIFLSIIVAMIRFGGEAQAVTRGKAVDRLQAIFQSDSRNVAKLLVADSLIDDATGRTTKRVVRRLLREAAKEDRARRVRRLGPVDLQRILASDPEAATGMMRVDIGSATEELDF